MAYDQNLWAEKLDYAKRKPSQSLETFRRIRIENYELLKDMPEEAFQRIATHSQRGQMTLLEFVKLFAVHAEKHTQQIRTVRDRFKQAKASAQV